MTHSAKELADFLGCPLEGNAVARVSGVASPDAAGDEDLIYVDSVRHVERAAASSANVAVAGAGVSLPGKTVLRAANPKLAFARAAAWLVPAEPVATGVHPTAVIAASVTLAPGVAVGPYAVIEEGVEIGEGSEIGAFCFLGARSHIGERCRLYPRVTLYAGTRLANRVILHSGVVVGSDGFGYVEAEGRREKFPQVGGVELEEDVEVGANSTIDRGSLDRTVIGRGVKLDNLVHVAHNVRIGENTVIAAQTGVSGSSTIGKNVLIGGQVGIADHCGVEDGAIVGAQAGIPTGKIIRSGQVVWSTPARPLEKIKEQVAWIGRLPALAERVKKLEERLEMRAR